MAKSYFHDGTDWRELVRGEQGEEGPRGPRGPRGIQGPPGTLELIGATPSLTVDTSAGITISLGDHIIHHESGWRDVTEHMRDGWSGNVYVWRNENTVVYNFASVSRSEDSPATVVGIVPGYTPLSTENVIRDVLTTSDSPSVSYRANITQYGATLTIPTGVSASGRVSFPTQRAIPASLPGTPA